MDCSHVVKGRFVKERHALWKQEVGTHVFILSNQIKSIKTYSGFHVAPRSPYSPETAYALRSTTPKNPYASGSITPRSVGGLRSTTKLWSCHTAFHRSLIEFGNDFTKIYVFTVQYFYAMIF